MERREEGGCVQDTSVIEKERLKQVDGRFRGHEIEDEVEAARWS